MAHIANLKKRAAALGLTIVKQNDAKDTTGTGCNEYTIAANERDHDDSYMFSLNGIARLIEACETFPNASPEQIKAILKHENPLEQAITAGNIRVEQLQAHNKPAPLPLLQRNPDLIKVYTDSINSTDLLCEAALCIWEWMLENRDGIPALDKTWDEVGTIAMRHAAIGLAPAACTIWDMMSEDEQYACIPYDWGFIPTFAEQVDWDEWIDFGTSALAAGVDLTAVKTAILKHFETNAT